MQTRALQIYLDFVWLSFTASLRKKVEVKKKLQTSCDVSEKSEARKPEFMGS
jgi:hypothetical protein